MERRPARAQLRRRRFIHRIIAVACLITIGFGVGIVVTLKAVGFS